MTNISPTLADPEVAAAVFKSHLEDLIETGRPKELGWEFEFLDPLRLQVRLPAKREDGSIDYYYVLLGAQYYDTAPPSVYFIDPETKHDAAFPSKWFPNIPGTPSWFKLHENYPYQYKPHGQLVCFSFSLDYYLTDHHPKESEMWTQGRHTLAATLYRLQEMLLQPCYGGPSKLDQ